MMMETGYSTLFSLGLSSIHTSFPFSPIDAAQSPVLPQSAATTSVRTPSTPCSSSALVSPWTAYMLAPPPPPPTIYVDTGSGSASAQRRPPLGRRRSSLTAANSPLGGLNVKSPNLAASSSLARSAKAIPNANSNRPRSKENFGGRAPAANRRSESDATPRAGSVHLRSSSMGDGMRARRGPVCTPAPAPPNVPLPAVPTKDATTTDPSPVRPPSDVPSFGRVLADKERALNATVRQDLSLCVPSTAGAVSPQTLLTPGFAAKLAFALATPPSSALCSPIDPMMCASSYFDATPTPRHVEDIKEN